jgi:hypothetical protein
LWQLDRLQRSNAIINPKGGERMKKLVSFVLVTMLAVSLSACVPAGKKEGAARVKCPACGYEFDAPKGGQ